MAATDQPYRNQRTLDIVFGLSCLAMLLSTLWMFAQDFNRSFKNVQRTFRDVEATIAERDMIGRIPDEREVKEKQAALTRARAKFEVAGAVTAETFGSTPEERKANFEEAFATWRDPQASGRDAAKQKLIDGQKAFESRQSALTAQRELADERYRTIKADVDAQSSYYNIAVDDGDKARAKQIEEKLADLNSQLQEARKELDRIDAQIQAEIRGPLKPYEDAVVKAEEDVKKVTANFDRFAKVAAQKAWAAGDTIRALPILEGFESPIKIKQQWLPDLTIDYSFKEVPRYDRCMTCHLGIDRATFDRATLAGLGDEEENKRLLGKLQAAKEVIEVRESKGENLGYSSSDLPGEKTGSFGLVLLLLAASSLVAAVSLGALERSWRLGMQVLTVGLGISLLSTAAIAFFSPRIPTVKQIKLTEGQISQYCVHPKLDLYVDSNSAHPVEKFGCTICHAGQGSATDFNLASHTPTDAAQQDKWKEEHHYHPSHYWDYPMLPKRFVESSCLKCHHQVTDLVRNGVKEEAPKLLRGFNLVSEMGCFGCHEIQGIKGLRPVGPDMRLEPSPALEWLSPADQEKAKSDPANPPGTMRKVGPSLRRLAEKTNADWVAKWINAPRSFREDTKMPHFYHLANNSPEVLPDDQKKFPAAEIVSMTHYLLEESRRHLDPKAPSDSYREFLLKGTDKPEKTLVEKGLVELHKDLVAGKLDDRGVKELFDVTRRFADLALLSSPTRNQTINDTATRLRQVQERLQEMWRRKRETEDTAASPPITEAGRELESLTAALVEAARPTLLKDRIVDGEGNAVALPAKDGDSTRGRRLFSEKGCLACHSHQGTAKSQKDDSGTVVNYAVKSEANFAPELSRIHEKLSPALPAVAARAWLVQWLLNPNVYHPRTRMPVTHLSAADANDIATWLLSQKKEWQGQAPEKVELNDLRNLARVYLAKAPGVTAEDLNTFLPAEGDKLPGIPKARMASFARDAEERRLEEGRVTEDALKWYVGKKAIGRLGCYACHDIPGFEAAKPIGTGLNDWGKKEHERLAFEDADNFVKTHFNVVPVRKSRAAAEARLLALWREGAAVLPDADKTKLEEWLDSNPQVTAAAQGLKEKGGNQAVNEETAELLNAATRSLPRKSRTEATNLTEELRSGKFFESVDGKPPMEEIFYRAVEHHQREGFLHLKLAEPRAYDYNRRVKWDDRLRMPQFKFSRTRKLANETDEAYQARLEKEEAEAREAVMTFILGLVAEPIPLKYVHSPKPDKAAEIAGRKVLDKYNCASCHQIRPGQYEFQATPETLASLEKLHQNAKESIEKDHPVLNHSAWFGPQQTSDLLTATGYLMGADRDTLWPTDAVRFTGTDGVARELPAGTPFRAPAGLKEYPGYGGTWTNLMVPYAQKRNPQKYADDPKARTALPPPLVREGERVQPDWLYQFLLNPGVVRPQNFMLLRMPKFNMSPEESRALVNYFAAVSRVTNPGAGVTAPYVNVEQRDAEYWSQASAEYEKTVQRTRDEARAREKDAKDAAAKKKWEALAKQADEALKRKDAIPKDARVKDFYSREAFRLLPICLQCHSVGNVKAGGEPGKEKPAEGEAADQGPNLVLSAERLRPGWTGHWIGNPMRLFTYPPVMPQNFPNHPDPLEWKQQDRFVGSPSLQVRAVRDLLLDGPRLRDLLATEKLQPAEGGSK